MTIDFFSPIIIQKGIWKKRKYVHFNKIYLICYLDIYSSKFLMNLNSYSKSKEIFNSKISYGFQKVF